MAPTTTSEKEFLGESGEFNGEDIVDIICKQPATARFISRHMYHFFVADEPPVKGGVILGHGVSVSMVSENVT